LTLIRLSDKEMEFIKPFGERKEILLIQILGMFYLRKSLVYAFLRNYTYLGNRAN